MVISLRERRVLTYRSLPITAQPAYIKEALAAGKHVLSEKPIAKDLNTAQDLLAWYNDKANIDKSKTLWGVAENFRFISKWLKTAAEVQKLGGIKTFRVLVRNKVGTDGKYFSMSPDLKVIDPRDPRLTCDARHTLAQNTCLPRRFPS